MSISQSHRSTAPGRPRDLVKRQAILETAKNQFLQKGYEGSSMDAIAQEAGVSKLTVYNHFKDKESLFVAAIQAHCDNQLPPLDFELQPDMPIGQALLKIAMRFQSIIYSQEGLELHRLMCSMTRHNPDLVQGFFAAGPARVMELMTRLLQQAQLQHKLEIDDCRLAAEHFLSLFSGCMHMRVLLELEAMPTSEQLAWLADQAVRRFIRAYQP